MLLAALALIGAAALFALGYLLAAHRARRRWLGRARRAARLHDELERQLIKLGAGLGVGA